jgi:chromate reductase, NAD(P)H dehydrogenase (quinone)
VTTLKVLAISGSLRDGSHNTALIRAAIRRAPDCMTITQYRGLGDLPHYNQDRDNDASIDTSVLELRHEISQADGLLIATPEYNYSIPGVLKNALDWASRPVTGSVLFHKPVAIMGAAPGNFGTVRAQQSLRQVFQWTQSPCVAQPEVHVMLSATRLDGAGEVADDTTLEFIASLLQSLARLATAVRHD